jgi:hypothetical protein
MTARSPLTDTIRDALHAVFACSPYVCSCRWYEDPTIPKVCDCGEMAEAVASAVEGEHQRLRDLAAAVHTFIHDTCDNDDCRDDGYCLGCICALEDAYTRLAPDSQEGAA